MNEIVYKNESYKILGCCFEVYKQKGCGFSESVYQKCLAIEFELQHVSYIAQPKIEMEYKGRLLNQFFRPDFICFGKIIVELKSLPKLIDANRAQTISYLNATNYDLALLMNFSHYPKLEHKRIANTQTKTGHEMSARNELKSWF